VTTPPTRDRRRPYTPALTLWRPWAACFTMPPEAVAKRVENRTWVTRYRGDVWLHAGLTFDADAFGVIDEIVPGVIPHDPAQHPGGIVALAELVDVCTKQLTTFDFFGPGCECGKWAFPGQAHWQFENVRVLPEPVPGPGGRSLWKPADDVEALCRAQMAGHAV
jgi:hypothetical protein